MSAVRPTTVAASVVLVLAAAGCDRHASAHAGQAASVAGSIPAPRGAGAPAVLPALESGDQRIYAVKLRSEARVDQQALTQFSLEGQLIVTTVDVNSERVLLRGTVQNAKLGTELSSLKSQFAKLERDVETPFLFEIARGGVIRAFYFADEPSGLVIGVRRSLTTASCSVVSVTRRVHVSLSRAVELV